MGIIGLIKIAMYIDYLIFKKKFITTLCKSDRRKLITDNLIKISCFKKRWCDDLFHYIDKELLISGIMYGYNFDYKQDNLYLYSIFQFIENTDISFNEYLYEELENAQANRQEFNKFIKPFLMSDTEYSVDTKYFIKYSKYLSDKEKVEFCSRYNDLGNYTYNQLKSKKYKKQLDFIMNISNQ